MMQLGTRLGETGQQLLASLPQPVRSPSELVRVMGLNKVIASRFLSALGKRDPMAVVFYLPGMDTLRRVTEAARERGAAPEAIRQWTEQVDLLDDFLKHEVGGKQGLDAIASAALPDARERFEMANRQAMYRGASNFYGATCDIELLTIFIHPSKDGTGQDVLILNGMIGFRRLRAGKPITISRLAAASESSEQSGPASASQLNGRPWKPAATQMLLSEFCSQPMPEILSTVTGRFLCYQLAGDDFGLASACDIYVCQYNPYDGTPLPSRTKGKEPYVSTGTRFPSQRQVFDVLIHRDVWSGRTPRLYVRSPAPFENDSPNFDEMDFDQVNVLETIRSLGSGSRGCRVSEIPRYIEVIDSICAQRQWDPTAFRGYRCDSRYPIWGALYYMAFGSPGGDPSEPHTS